MSPKILSDSESHMNQSLSSPGDTPSSSTDRKVSVFTENYPYEPLPSDRHIRLLRFEPPVSSSTQNIPLISATLQVSWAGPGCRDPSSYQPYKALSYEWGSPPSNPSDARTMLLDNHPIHIRQNLHDALHSILHNHEKLYGTSPFYLWVDALCINQLDDREKGRQVQLMKTIYEAAEMVIVWLGKGTACTDEAMALLKMKEGDLHKYVREGNLSWKERQGLTDLYCDATYWRRVWILQEFALARDYVILCNRAFVTKECFESGLSIAKWWSIRGPRDKSGTEAHTNWPAQDLVYRAPVERMIALGGLLARTPGPTLDNWLDIVCIHGFKATDPRDYVFAILGISRDGDEIVPDYELSTTEVYCMAISTREARSRISYDENFSYRDWADLMGISRDRARKLQQKLEEEEEDMSSLEDQDMWDSDLEFI
ncbi:heterokaryon incompatibility protein-domain-containing protein [Neurospora hispaniola]|uniref:Heterokaryon incompatibility protein-domain-containing protein n=1 Tax=Neurospora hispaniola TaxID=588809 RepID=A0AAJ0I6J0_9PEZI|nr:heterokaryon incompatibility protein-domain-containing protein [Neurospora hispaniola]